MYICIYVCICICIYVHVYVYVYMYVYIYIYMYICTYIYTYIYTIRSRIGLDGRVARLDPLARRTARVAPLGLRVVTVAVVVVVVVVVVEVVVVVVVSLSLLRCDVSPDDGSPTLPGLDEQVAAFRRPPAWLACIACCHTHKRHGLQMHIICVRTH